MTSFLIDEDSMDSVDSGFISDSVSFSRTLLIKHQL